jgi:hypothetical protein
MLSHMRRSYVFPTLVLLVCTLACSDDTPTETTWFNVGRACVSGAPDEPHSVEVTFGICMSSCDEVVETSCLTALDGTELTISAAVTISTHDGKCSNTCEWPTVTCETEPIPAGDYELVFGDQPTKPLAVPAATDEPSCVGILFL